MKLILIAAVNRKRIIGRNGSIPWNIPEDMQRFKRLTVRHTVIMGRKTYESIGKPLPERRNIIISHDASAGDIIEHYNSVDEALLGVADEETVFVIGGGEVFRQTIGRADEILLTVVENDEEGDTYFPEIRSRFVLRSAERRDGFRFEEYIRSADRPEAQ